MANSIIMYIILRRDLLTQLNWPFGALITQACHASTAVLWMARDDSICHQYMENMDNMRKITLEVRFYFSILNIVL